MCDYVDKYGVKEIANIGNCDKHGYQSVGGNYVFLFLVLRTDEGHVGDVVLLRLVGLILGLVVAGLLGLAGEGLLELLLALEVALAALGLAGLAPLLALLADEVGDGHEDGEDALDALAEVREALAEVLLGLVVVLPRQRRLLLGAVRPLGLLRLGELLRRLAPRRHEHVLGARGAGPLEGERLLAVLFGGLGVDGHLLLALGLVLGHGAVVAAEERH